jgi:hypothetical protein
MLEGGNIETNNNTQNAESNDKKETNAGHSAGTPPNNNIKKLVKAKVNSSINVELVDSDEIKQF